MLFVLRVVLVIGALSYFALTRGGSDPAGEVRKLITLPSPGAVVPAVAASIPAETRDRVIRDVMARGLMAELSRRAAEPAAQAPSRDTLNDADRTPAWRGVERR